MFKPIYSKYWQIHQQDLPKVAVLKALRKEQCAAPFVEEPVHKLPSVKNRQKCNI